MSHWPDFTDPNVLYSLDVVMEYFRDAIVSEISALPSVNSLKDLPREGGVYFVVNHDSDGFEIIYAGTSTDLSHRWQGHPLRKEFQLRNWRIYYYCMSGIERERFEALMILLLNPRLNRRINSMRLYHDI